MDVSPSDRGWGYTQTPPSANFCQLVDSWPIETSPLWMKYFRKFANVVAAARKKPPRFVGAPGFGPHLWRTDDWWGSRGREDRGKNRKGGREETEEELKGLKYPGAAGRRGQGQGSACLPAPFVGSQTGTRNAWLTGDSSRLKRLKKWGLSG